MQQEPIERDRWLDVLLTAARKLSSLKIGKKNVTKPVLCTVYTAAGK